MKQSSSENENVVRSITPPKHDSRWRWMAMSSAAVGAAAPAAALAGQVQIDLTGSVATFNNGVLTDNIKRDMTGDGASDLPNLTVEGSSSGAFFRSFLPHDGPFLRVGSRRYITTTFSSGYFAGYSFGLAAYISNILSSTVESFRASVGYGVTSTSYYTAFGQGKANQDVDAVVPVSFTDARINSGARTNGFVHCRALNLAQNSHRVEMLRLIFNDSSTDFGNPLVFKTTTYPAWVPPSPAAAADNAAAISKLKKKIKKLKKKQKKLKKAGKAAAATKLGKKIKKLKKQLKAL